MPTKKQLKKAHFLKRQKLLREMAKRREILFRKFEWSYIYPYQINEALAAWKESLHREVLFRDFGAMHRRYSVQQQYNAPELSPLWRSTMTFTLIR